jgi:hypothetical protein
MTQEKPTHNKVIEFLFYRRIGFLLMWLPIYIYCNILAYKNLMFESVVIALILFVIFTIRLNLIRFNRMLLWTYIIILAIPYCIFFLTNLIDIKILDNITLHQSIENAIAWTFGSYILGVSTYSVITIHPKFLKSENEDNIINE